MPIDFNNLDAENGVKKTRDLLNDFLKMAVSKAILGGKNEGNGGKNGCWIGNMFVGKESAVSKVANNQWVKTIRR